MSGIKIAQPNVVSRAEWLAARKQLLVKEKELTRERDALNRQRRELPWVRVEKDYVFDAPGGRETLSDLFGDRSQLMVYHFMFAPEDLEGCPYCSFLADHIDGARVHLEHHDVSLVVVSRAPLPRIEAFKQRMGWHFKWVSSYGSDFNFDYQVSFTKESISQGPAYYNFEERQSPTAGEAPGTSVFARDEDGQVFHTYSQLRARWRPVDRDLQLPRPHPQGPQRDGPCLQPDRLGAAPRQV